MRRRQLLCMLAAALLIVPIAIAIPLGAQDDSKWDSFKIDRSRGSFATLTTR